MAKTHQKRQSLMKLQNMVLTLSFVSGSNPKIATGTWWEKKKQYGFKIFVVISANLYDIPSYPLSQALGHLQLNGVEEKNLCSVVVLHTRHHTRGHRELAWARVHSHLDNRGHMGPEDPSNKKRTMNKRYKRGALRSLGGQR